MSQKKAQPFRVREIFPKAYHEAGHAVVGHVIGRLIQEVSIVPDRLHGYKGYCRCSAFMEAANNHFEWQEGSTNPEIVTFFYAGTVATEMICQMHGWQYERLRDGDEDDLDMIDQWCRKVSTHQEEWSAVKEISLAKAKEILAQHWNAVDALATELIVHDTVSGKDAHLIIRQALGEKSDDWRLGTWGIKG